MSQLSAVVRELRVKAGYSQRALAEKLGVTFTYISKIENDKTEYPPSEAVLRRLAPLLSVGEDWLIFEAGRFRSLRWPAGRVSAEVRQTTARTIGATAYRVVSFWLYVDSQEGGSLSAHRTCSLVLSRLLQRVCASFPDPNLLELVVQQDRRNLGSLT